MLVEAAEVVDEVVVPELVAVLDVVVPEEPDDWVVDCTRVGRLISERFVVVVSALHATGVQRRETPADGDQFMALPEKMKSPQMMLDSWFVL